MFKITTYFFFNFLPDSTDFNAAGRPVHRWCWSDGQSAPVGTKPHTESDGALNDTPSDGGSVPDDTTKEAEASSPATPPHDAFATFSTRPEAR